MEEKRKSIRIKTKLTITFKPKNAHLACGSSTKDISEVGVNIPTKHYYNVDTIMNVEIRSGHSKGPIKALAKVVRIVNKSDSHFPYEIVLQFIEFPGTNLTMLREYIHQYIEQEQRNNQ